jgi:hypothetical protein
MQIIDEIYIGGAFVKPHGDELFDLFNPATERVIARVLLADAQDARDAIAATLKRQAPLQRDWEQSSGFAGALEHAGGGASLAMPGMQANYLVQVG